MTEEEAFDAGYSAHEIFYQNTWSMLYPMIEKIFKISELHKRCKDCDNCHNCGQPAPCDTLKILQNVQS